MLHLEYLYASPLDLASLDVRAEIEALATIPGVNLTVLVLGLVLERARQMQGRKEAEQNRTGGKIKGRKGIGTTTCHVGFKHKCKGWGCSATLHKVRTATTETLAEVWRTLQSWELCSCCVIPCGDGKTHGNLSLPW